MAEEFNFTEDISSVLWRETFWLNALRAAGAGVVWGLLILIVEGAPGEGLVMLIGMPVTYFFFLLPIGLLAAWLSWIPFIGFITGLFALIVAVGDPLVYILKQFRPMWVPVEDPDMFSFQLIGFVMSAAEE